MPPCAGTPSIPPIDAAWNIGVWCRNTSSASNRHTMHHVVQVEHLGAVVEQHALRQAGGAAGVHEDDGIVLVGLVGDLRRRAREQVFVLDVVRRVAVADHHDVLDADRLAHLVDDAARRTGR